MSACGRVLGDVVDTWLTWTLHGDKDWCPNGGGYRKHVIGRVPALPRCQYHGNVPSDAGGVHRYAGPGTAACVSDVTRSGYNAGRHCQPWLWVVHDCDAGCSSVYDVETRSSGTEQEQRWVQSYIGAETCRVLTRCCVCSLQLLITRPTVSGSTASVPRGPTRPWYAGQWKGSRDSLTSSIARCRLVGLPCQRRSPMPSFSYAAQDRAM